MPLLPLAGVGAVLWDLDGTLVDSHTPMRNVWSEFAASLGLSLNSGEQDLIFFMQSWEEVHDWFAARCDAAPAQHLLAEQVLGRAIALAPTFAVYADSAAEVELLCAGGVPQAVVTSWGADSGRATGCRVVRVDLHRSAGGEMSALR